MNTTKRAILSIFFPSKLRRIDRWTEIERKFPCPDCRPSDCSFYYGFPMKCSTCKREYSI